MQQEQRLGRVECLGRYEHDTRIHPFLDRFSEKVVDHRPHTQLPHSERVLDDDAMERAGAHRGDEGLARIEADELDLPGTLQILEGEQRSGGGRLVGCEQALNLMAVTIEQVLRSRLRGVACSSRVLIGRNQLDPRKGLDLVHETPLARLSLDVQINPSCPFKTFPFPKACLLILGQRCR